jgi:hypothetical protein
MTWKTWQRHKPSTMDCPILIVYDRQQVLPSRIVDLLGTDSLGGAGVQCYSWPPTDVEYPAGTDKWTDSQRYRMLSGFVHATAKMVDTPFWLKLDTDVVATGQDNWIDPNWFSDNPAIVAQPWGFTKPANQMVDLDTWVATHGDVLTELRSKPPLNLRPKPGWSMIRHPRIISWCGFFNTEFTRKCSEWAELTCGHGLLPVPSQDGFIWYCAARLGLPIVRPQMKNLGWEHWSTDGNVQKAYLKAMETTDVRK